MTPLVRISAAGACSSATLLVLLLAGGCWARDLSATAQGRRSLSLLSGSSKSVALTIQGAAALAASLNSSQTGPAATNYTYHTYFKPKGINNKNAGPVLSQPIQLYISWVGNLSDSRRQLLKDFIVSLNPQADPLVTVDDWYNTTTLYYGGKFPQNKPAPTGGWVSSSIYLAGEYNVTDDILRQWGIKKKVLSQNDVWTIVSQSVSAAPWPATSNGIYFVFTSEDHKNQGACQSFCGWHDTKTLNNTQVAYSWVGVLKCSSVCWTTMPNSIDRAMHAAINVFAHETVEAASDPFINAWRDSSGQENADKCAWMFGTSAGTNMVGIGGVPYMVQLNWNPQTGVCSLGIPTTA